MSETKKAQKRLSQILNAINSEQLNLENSLENNKKVLETIEINQEILVKIKEEIATFKKSREVAKKKNSKLDEETETKLSDLLVVENSVEKEDGRLKIIKEEQEKTLESKKSKAEVICNEIEKSKAKAIKEINNILKK